MTTKTRQGGGNISQIGCLEPPKGSKTGLSPPISPIIRVLTEVNRGTSHIMLVVKKLSGVGAQTSNRNLVGFYCQLVGANETTMRRPARHVRTNRSIKKYTQLHEGNSGSNNNHVGSRTRKTFFSMLAASS